MTDPSPAGAPRSSASRREQILDAAAPLFGERDLASVTMEQVARRAGVAKGTLYNYFSSKEDLYASILEARMRHLLSALERSLRDTESTRARLRKISIHTLMFLLKYPDFFRMLRKEELRNGHGGNGAETLRSSLREMLHGLLERGMEEGTIRRLPAPLATDLILGAIEGGVLRFLEERNAPARGSADLEDFFEMIWKIVAAPRAAISDPLGGCTILVTREEDSNGDLSAEITRLGGTAIRLPLLRTAPPEDLAPLRAAASDLGGYRWVLFTSARAVDALAAAVPGGAGIPGGVRIGTVGRATAERARSRFGRVDRIAAEESGAGLAAALLAEEGVAGLRVLFPRAEAARPDLVRLLRAGGVDVCEVVAYRTLENPIDAAPIRAALQAGKIDAVTFASGSAVAAFARRIGLEDLPSGGRRVAIASLGPSTSEALREAGLTPDAEAARPSMPELARAAVKAIRHARIRNEQVSQPEKV